MEPTFRDWLIQVMFVFVSWMVVMFVEHCIFRYSKWHWERKVRKFFEHRPYRERYTRITGNACMLTFAAVALGSITYWLLAVGFWWGALIGIAFVLYSNYEDGKIDYYDSIYE